MTHPTEADKAQALVDQILASGKLTRESLALAKAAKQASCRVDETRPAALEACRTCPWRRENADADDEFLTDEALVHYWNKIRDGAPFVCHKTSVVVTPEAAERGWKAAPEQAAPRECTGALAQMLKEERLRVDLGSQEAYLEARGPYGVTRRGFQRLARRRAGKAHPAVRDLDGLDGFGRDWFPDPDGASSALIVPACYCPVCTRHGEAHQETTLTTPAGERVQVDASLAPLIEHMWAAGGITVASCEWMADAIDRLWPEQRSMILRKDNGAPEEMNYRTIVARDLAFVRGIDGPAWTHLTEVAESAGVRCEVDRLGRLVQVAFPRHATAELVRRW